MACSTCNKNKKLGMYSNINSTSFPPYNSSDIFVYEDGNTRQMNSSDWPSNRHKLLLFYPESFTPVCTSEMGAINKWVEKFNELDCDIYSVSADPIEKIKDWYESEESLKNPNYKVLSSYLLPVRLGLINDNKVKRASVIITKDGDMIVQEHFFSVGRSISELHRTLFAYNTGSFCGEGWKSPEDGFLNDNR